MCRGTPPQTGACVALLSPCIKQGPRPVPRGRLEPEPQHPEQVVLQRSVAQLPGGAHDAKLRLRSHNRGTATGRRSSESTGRSRPAKSSSGSLSYWQQACPALAFTSPSRIVPFARQETAKRAPESPPALNAASRIAAVHASQGSAAPRHFSETAGTTFRERPRVPQGRPPDDRRRAAETEEARTIHRCHGHPTTRGPI